MATDGDKLQDFMGKMAGDMGAAMSASLVVLGDRLGLYKALADAGPSTSAGLAAKAGVNERNLREWLAAQAASGYVDYDAVPDVYRRIEKRRPSPSVPSPIGPGTRSGSMFRRSEYDIPTVPATLASLVPEHPPLKKGVPASRGFALQTS